MVYHDLFNRIEIKGLFGDQNEIIDFTDIDSRFKILYGLNGSGKTTVLRLIEAAIKWDPIVLWQTEFESITFLREKTDDSWCFEPGWDDHKEMWAAGLFGAADEDYGEDGEVYCSEKVLEEYSIKRIMNKGNTVTVIVTCDVKRVWFCTSEPTVEWIAPDGKCHYEKIIQAPEINTIGKDDLKRIFHALDTLYGLQSNPNNSEYVFSTENGAEEYSFNDILRFIPSDLFPKGHWSIRPDPTSRFLQLPIQESLIPLVLKIPNRDLVRNYWGPGNEAVKSHGFTIKEDNIGDFEFDQCYMPNLYRNEKRPNFPVSIIKSDRLTSLMKNRYANKDYIPTNIDAEAIQRLTDDIKKYTSWLIDGITNIIPNFTNFVEAFEQDEKSDRGLLDNFKMIDSSFVKKDSQGEINYHFQTDIFYVLRSLYHATNNVLEHWDEADSKINEFGMLLARFEFGPLPVPAPPSALPPPVAPPPPVVHPRTDIAEHFDSPSNQPVTEMINSILTRMKWLERLTQAISLLNLRMGGKTIKISSQGSSISVISSSGRTLSVYHLSSGEMQLLLIFTYIVNKIGYQHSVKIREPLPPLVLIDEPELSMHISWQRCFIDDLLEIFNDLPGIIDIHKIPTPQFIIATHSPSIVANHMHRGHELRALGFIENLEM